MRGYDKTLQASNPDHTYLSLIVSLIPRSCKFDSKLSLTPRPSYGVVSLRCGFGDTVQTTVIRVKAWQ